jgi:hypothetical protein
MTEMTLAKLDGLPFGSLHQIGPTRTRPMHREQKESPGRAGAFKELTRKKDHPGIKVP